MRKSLLFSNRIWGGNKLEIPFLGGAYEGRSKSINAQQSVNLFPVYDNDEGKTPIAMYGTPGTDDFSDTGTTAIVRRMHVMGDYLYAVVGDTVYEVDSDGSATDIGTITTSTGHVGMADNGTQLLICDGTVDGYVATIGTLTAVEDGIPWTSGETAASNNWTSVSYGNGVYMSVSSSGTGDRTMSSSDGSVWSIGVSPKKIVTTMAKDAVATATEIDTYHPDRFADGESIGVEMDDGIIHWTTVSGTPTATTITLVAAITGTVAEDNKLYTLMDNEWTGVTFGNGTFVAVSSSGTDYRAMTSPDGITCTTRVSAADNDWTAVAYGNELFVAVADSGTGNRVMTSPDGITWTIRTSAGDNDWTDITYGGGLFVAVSTTDPTASGNLKVMTSPDGVTWTMRVAPEDNDWQGVTHGNGLFVAVANTGTGDRVMTSPDGITWTIRTSAANNNWTSVAYGTGLYTAVASSGTGDRIMVSEDGITWETKASVADNSWTDVVFGTTSFVAVSNAGVMVSPDGSNEFPAATDCVFFDGYFIVSVKDSGRIQLSGLYDAYTWDSLDFATAEASPDALVGVGTTRQNIWLFGEYSTEVYYNSGNLDFPFQRVPGAILDLGCGSLTSVTEIEGVLYWLSNKKTIVRNSGYSFETISTPSINYQMSTYSTVEDAVAYTYSLEGRTFYVISFPTADKTWVVNVQDGQWHEWRSLS